MRAVLAATLVLAAGCGVGLDHERLGDRRYAEGAWNDALAEYRLAARQRRPSHELRAKLGGAALRAGALTDAAAAYQELAAGDIAGRGEGVEGLVRTARAAVAAHDVAALHQVTDALQKVAPERVGEAVGPALADVLDDVTADAADLLLTAADLDRTVADSLVATWAELGARSGRCEGAEHAWTGLMHRRPSPAVAARARAGIAGCRIEAGRALIAAGNLEEAESALHVATLPGSPDSLMRLAWVLIGDARWAAGDSALAAEAYRKATEGADEDNPLVQRAQEQLRRLTGNPIQP